MTGSESTARRAAHLGPERRRPQVLDVASRIAAEEGIAGVTIAAVAQQMKVTRPVIYACYPDRVALVTALLDRSEEELIADVVSALPRRRPDATEDDFVEGFRALLGVVARRRQAWRLVFDRDHDPVLSERLERARSTVRTAAEMALRPAFKRWGTADVDAKFPILVTFFMSACESAVRSMMEAPDLSPDQVAELLGPAVFRALRHS